MDMMWEAIGELKPCRSGSPADGLAPEMAALFPTELVDALRRAFNRYILWDGPGAKPKQWHHLFIICLAKTADPVLVKLWRPIALIPLLEKILDRCLLKLINLDLAELTSNSWGFCKGHQASEIVHCLSVITQRADEWDAGLAVLRGDVHKAFDSMRREDLEEIMVDAGVAPEVVAAVLQELQCEVDIHLGGAVAGDVPYDGGGKQGGVTTPTLWRLYLHAAIGRRLAELQDQGVGFKFWHNGKRMCVNHFIYADDVWLLGGDVETLKFLAQEASTGLHQRGLKWKTDEKFRFCANRSVPNAPETLAFAAADGQGYEAARRTLVDALGHEIDIEGRAAPTVAHRLSAMNAHFWNRPPLRNKHIPLMGRVRRYDQTVRATPLYAAGVFRLTQDLAQDICATDHRLVRAIWKPRRLRWDDGVVEPWGDWQRRTYIGAKALLHRAGVPTLLESVLRVRHQWAGHVARLPPSSLVSVLTSWRDTRWWTEYSVEQTKADPRNRTLWKHSRPGTHHRWDTDVFNHYGPDWRSLAADRGAWKAREDAWVLAEHARLSKKKGNVLENAGPG